MEGCGDDGKGACVETDPNKIAANARILKRLEREAHDRKCAAGNDAYCVTALEHPRETIAFVGGGLLLAGVGMTAIGVTTVSAETVTITTTTVEVTNAACGGDMCIGEVDELSRVFHSGYGSQVAAEAWAKTHNAVTLSQTEAGAQLTQIFETAGYNVMRPFAEAASAEWAAGASGPVHAILKLPLNPNNIWGTIEYPALLVNDAVTTIVPHFLP